MDRERHDKETRLRLLRAAGEIFSKKGFRAATVREICSKAGANVAAVNYHFESKQNLYLAVLEYAHEEALRRYPPDLGLPDDPTPEDRLAAFIRSMLLRTLGKGKPAWHGRLMARERFEPTGFLDHFIDKAIAPRARIIQGIVAELLGPGADPLTIQMCAQSVTGQCRHYVSSRHVVKRVAPAISLEEADIAVLARHITRFSLAGIRAIAAKHDLKRPGEPQPEIQSGEIQ